MASRAGLAAILALLAASCLVGRAESRPSISASIYTVRVDPRLCPSPLCGGYWAALANRARTRCSDGLLRPRCYVAQAFDEDRHPLPAGVPDGALVRAEIEPWTFEGFGELGSLVVVDVYAPAGRAPESGGFFRLVDTGVRCVRAPCFSLRASRVNRPSRTLVSGIDLGSSHAKLEERVRAEAALGTKSGLLARGRIAPSPDGGRIFRVTRFYLRSQS